MVDIDLTSVDEVQIVAVLILANDDVIGHEQDCLQVVYDETLLDFQIHRHPIA